MLGARRAVAVVVGLHARGVADRDRLGGAHDRGQPLERLAFARLARAQLVEGGHEERGQLGAERDRDARVLQQAVGLALHERHLGREVADRVDRLEVEPALERGRHGVHAAVARVGGGDHVEALPREHAPRRALQLGDDQHPVAQDREQAVLDLERAAGDLLEPHELPGAHAEVQRRGHQRPLGRPLGQEERVVPGVLDRVLAGGGAPLDREPRVAADRGREQLAEVALGRARLADQHQAAVAGERHHAALHEPAAPHELGDHLVLGVAEHEPEHRAGREPPARRARGALVERDQAGELVRVELLGGRALERLARGRGGRGRGGPGGALGAGRGLLRH